MFWLNEISRMFDKNSGENVRSNQAYYQADIVIKYNSTDLQVLAHSSSEAIQSLIKKITIFIRGKFYNITFFKIHKIIMTSIEM